MNFYPLFFCISLRFSITRYVVLNNVASKEQIKNAKNKLWNSLEGLGAGMCVLGHSFG